MADEKSFHNGSEEQHEHSRFASMRCRLPPANRK